MPLKVVIACGGTGGHLFPGIAVAEELQGRGHDVVALISEKEVDAVASKGYTHLKFETVPAIAMPRLLSPAAIRFGFRFFKALRECRGILDSHSADAVLGMGGFTSLPPVLAARSHKAKAFVHESNAVPGKANRLSGRFCDLVLLGFEECGRYFPGGKWEVVGTPVRRDLVSGMDKAQAREHFDLTPDRRTLLVMGGSQGARGVNRAVCDALPSLTPDSLQVLHVAGTRDFDEVKRAYADSPVQNTVLPFCGEMGIAYAAADLAISRAGASSLAELSTFGLPALLVPFPFAADDHQLKNADIFAREKAVLVVEEKCLNGKNLAKMVNDLLAEPGCLEKLSKNVKRLAPEDAASKIADVIEASCKV